MSARGSSGIVLAGTVGVIAAALTMLVIFVCVQLSGGSMLMIALAVTVIWALTGHGRDIAETNI